MHFKTIRTLLGSGFANALPFTAMMLSLLFTQGVSTAFAQTVPGGDIQEEQLRTWQLIYGSESSSLTNRPVWNAIYLNLQEEIDGTGSWLYRDYTTRRYELPYGFEAGLFSPLIQTTTNSQVPYGGNNEAAWYGRGTSLELQGGFWITSDYFTVTFRPHLVRHGNNDFNEPRFIPRNGDDDPFYVAEGIGDIIDMPYRFGPESYNTADWGYSSVRLHYRAIETGFSTEPLTWGGNIQYPLMMSRNAPGVPHWFAGTRSPLTLPYIGSVEFRWMLGFPQDSPYVDEYDGNPAEEGRFLNAFNITYSPRWVPNLHIGHTRAFHSIRDERESTRSMIFDIFDPYQLKRLRERYGGRDEVPVRNELRSYYFRWVWPESRFELYGEFIRDGVLWDSRDLISSARHHAGYGFGIQKLFDAPLARKYRFQAEFTNLTPSGLQEVRPQKHIYSDETISQGHTNRGQVLGAAIGPGSNSQFFAVDGYSENGRFGLYFQRLADNNHFHFDFDRTQNRERVGTGWGDYWRHRTDLTFGTRFLYDFGSWILTGDISWTRLMNYGRFEYGVFGRGISISSYDPTDKDVENMKVQFGLQYRF
ncbi:MAG: hypothetical protein JJU46_05130 [Balneolaceae bacterium]|nr:hypothetical protein [Balneolaceae bacterium]MCH8549092.1 hypothetical protein [Balneolaceae bacterium]